MKKKDLSSRKYQKLPKVVLENKQNDRLMPDFILEPFDQNSMCDILDIKLPSLKYGFFK